MTNATSNPNPSPSISAYQESENLSVHLQVHRWRFLDSIFHMFGLLRGEVIHHQDHRFIVKTTAPKGVSLEIARAFAVAKARTLLPNDSQNLAEFSSARSEIQLDKSLIDELCNLSKAFGLPLHDMIHVYQNHSDRLAQWQEMSTFIRDLGMPPTSLIKAELRNQEPKPTLLDPANVDWERCRAVKQQADFALEKLKKLGDLQYMTQTGVIQNLTPDQYEAVQRTIQQACSHSIWLQSKMRPQEEGAAHPPLEMIVTIAPQIRLLTILSGEDLRIYGCWGKLVGEGSSGAVFRTVNLMTGDLTSPLDPRAVIKIPSPNRRLFADIDNVRANELGPFSYQSAHILAEHQHLHQLHALHRSIPGIQDPLQVRHLEEYIVVDCKKSEQFKTVQQPRKIDNEREVKGSKGNYRYHWGRFYGGVDVEQMIQHGNVPLVEKKEMAGQIFHGLAHLHSCRMTHGDIKPQNILVDCISGQYKAYLADFAGALAHPDNSIRPKEWIQFADIIYTQEFRLCSLHEQSNTAYENANTTPLETERLTAQQNFLQFEQLSDVFATCSTIYYLFLGVLPLGNAGNRDVELTNLKLCTILSADVLEKNLGYSELNLTKEQVKGLVRGLRAGYDLGIGSITASELQALFPFDRARYEEHA